MQDTALMELGQVIYWTGDLGIGSQGTPDADITAYRFPGEL